MKFAIAAAALAGLLAAGCSYSGVQLMGTRSATLLKSGASTCRAMSDTSCNQESGYARRQRELLQGTAINSRNSVSPSSPAISSWSNEDPIAPYYSPFAHANPSHVEPEAKRP